MPTTPDRRQFIAAAGGLTLASATSLPEAFALPDDVDDKWYTPLAKKPRVAAIFSEFRFRSHAFNLLENFLGPRLFRGRRRPPLVEIVSLYADQFPDDDLAREVSQRFNIPLYGSIEEALYRGRSRIAVDGVLAIVEHGDYPTNDLGQKLYPRKEFFDRAVDVMRQSNHFVPYFNDKHLSYCAAEAATMYATARRHAIPLMAGSSVPLAQRRPKLVLPEHPVFEHAVAIHGGGAEVYDIHALELLQSFVEERWGNEAGIESVQFLEGNRLRDASQSHDWPRDLIDAAMAAELGAAPESYFEQLDGDSASAPPHAILIRYRDGLRATVLKLGQSANRWNFACRLADEKSIRATALYNGPWGNRNLFAALSNAIQNFFVTREAPYSVVRTLLAGAALDAAMTSRQWNGVPVSTGYLGMRYSPRDVEPFREDGASWRVITKKTPEPKTFLE